MPTRAIGYVIDKKERAQRWVSGSWMNGWNYYYFFSH